MDFRDIQDAVIADSFDEADRASVRTWINHRYGLLLNQAEWTFTQASANVTVTAGSQTVTNTPSDMGVVLGLQRADGWPLMAIQEYREFASRYVGTTNNSAGTPQAFTVWAGVVSVGPTSNETSSSYLLTYEKIYTLLYNDTDTPIIPSEHHLALVFGAKADGLTLKSVLLADPFEQKFQAEVQAMQRRYLVAVRGSKGQAPAYRPGQTRRLGW